MGTGVQGYTSMQMILRAMPQISRIIACDLSPERRQDFIDRGKSEYPEIEFQGIDDHRDALKNSDIVVYATSADRPLLENGVPGEGITVITVCELLTRTSVGMFDRWYVDFAECALERYNDGGSQSAAARGVAWEDLVMDDVAGELGDVITGKLPGRTSDSERILAGAVGISVEDIICAESVYQKAMADGGGRILPFQDLQDL